MKSQNKKCWYAWTAGIIDGEGSVSITRSKRGNTKGELRYNVSITVRNTNKKMIEKLVELWGGRVHSKKIDKRNNCKRVWGWYLPASEVIDFGNKIKPFLITKRKQMNIALEIRERIESRKGIIGVLRNGHGSQWLMPKEREYRRRLREKIHLLNRPGRFAWIS